VTAASVALAEAEERVRSIEAAVERHRQAAQELQQELAADEQAHAAIDGLQAEAQAEGQQQLDLAEGKRAQAAEVAGQLSQLVQATADLRERLHALTASRRDTAEACSAMQERLHQAEINRTRAEAELAHIGERLQDGYELTPEEAAKQHSGTINRTQVDRRVRDLKTEIRAMGEVNVGAVEEYERLRAREDFLNGQRADLEDARADLLAIIQEIDDKTKSAFMDAFESVSREFDRIFRRLFDGGQTELVLTDPENILETGVEVVVQVPGKKVQNLLSLSGGERALTATALIFAMLRVRPAPFCFVDEVDAPLDEANVERFARLMRDFASDSQFVIITHNGLTMEAADRLVGITMEEPGISKVIAIKLEDAIAQAEEERRRRGQPATAG
jgi:chromosome segregation protein